MTFYVTGASPAHTLALCLEKGWAVQFTCLADACPVRADGVRRHRVTWGQAELQARDPRATLGQLADRAVCSKCGGRDGHVSTRNGGWAGTPI